MLVFNLFGKKDTECIRFERYFLSMGNCLEDFWSIMRKDMNGFSREEEEAFIGEYKNVLIVMSESIYSHIIIIAITIIGFIPLIPVCCLSFSYIQLLHMFQLYI